MTNTNYRSFILREIKLYESTFSNLSSSLKSLRSSSSNKLQFTDLFREKFIATSRDNWICFSVPNNWISAIAFSKFLREVLSCRLEAFSINCQAFIKYWILNSFFLLIKSLFLDKKCPINQLAILIKRAAILIIDVIIEFIAVNIKMDKANLLIFRLHRNSSVRKQFEPFGVKENRQKIMSRQHPEATELIWAENFLQAIVCAPKGTSKEEIIAFARSHISGTSAGWVMSKNDKGELLIMQCPAFINREHWVFEC